MAKGKRVLYAVSISSDNLLSFEDKPTPDQSEKIKQGLKDKGITIGIKGKTGEKIQKSLEDYYFRKDNDSNYSRSATMFLKGCGIDGMVHSEDRVYVIWTDDVISIESKEQF